MQDLLKEKDINKYIRNMSTELDLLNEELLKKKDISQDEYLEKLTKWLNEIIIKNKLIIGKPSKEKVTRVRQHVYWIDFGFNIGTEFNFPHFCVVIKEFTNTAIVVPISTEKEEDPEWKSARNLFVPIGKIEGLPREKKDCYALVNQIRTVSKQRLSDYYDKSTRKYIHIQLKPDQMKLILDAISQIGSQKIK